MTADIEGVESFISLVYDSWATVIQVSIGIAVLAIFVGAATAIAVVLAIGNYERAIY